MENLEINSFSYFESHLRRGWKALHTKSMAQANKGKFNANGTITIANKNKAKRLDFITLREERINIQ